MKPGVRRDYSLRDWYVGQERNSRKEEEEEEEIGGRDGVVVMVVEGGRDEAYANS